ncbi:MAG TPA: alpha-ketoglutarate-dependent dioxygenase AlkB [Bacteroidales bacterium]|nr:alpha-ketoglutarate-dependent dioxygenase AlkB [Bacteroidales bacterium]
MQQTLFGLSKGVNVLPYDGEALFYPGFLSETESNDYLKQLQQEYSYKQYMIRIYDKDVLQPRLTAFCGDPGKGIEYSEETMNVQPWTSTLRQLKKRVEAVAGTNFTHALLNLYRDGKDSVSWHRDKERNWGTEPVIASLSMGAARIFQFRNYEDKSVIRSVELTPGSLLIMKGATQRCWEHQIGKTNKRIGVRLNITFRVLVQE